MTTSSLVDQTNTNGKVIISWTDAGQSGSWVGYRIYHQSDEDNLDWTEVYETHTNQSSYAIDIYQYSNALTQRFTVVELTVDGFGQTSEGTYADYEEFSPNATDADYWLIHPTDQNLTIRLDQVTGDDFSDEWEKNEMVLLGRGRKVNLGARLGRKGSLNIRLTDDAKTARVKRKELTDLYASGVPIWLRDPFGDLTKVSISEPSFNRIAGLALHEAMDVTISYTEVV